MTARQRSITLTYRNLSLIAIGIALALITVTVFHAARSAAAPGPNEATYVPIAPCRLADTRPGDQNVGPRNTPIGENETLEQQVTGANGNCLIPTDAVGVALNVTAVSPTKNSYLTLFPFGGAVPTAANLNFVAGAPPTPNKVDVKLSNDGKIGVYNKYGTVHFIADIAGYYTHQGLQDIIDDLATKASAADVYTKAQINARTVTRSVSFPAQAINVRAGDTDITTSSAGFGLDWKYGANPGTIEMHRPTDWTGTGNVVIRMFFQRTNTAAGDVQFFVRPRNYDDNDPFSDSVGTVSDVQSDANMNYQEITMTVSAASLAKAWWELVIQRNTGLGAPYPNSVTVLGFDVEYLATQ